MFAQGTTPHPPPSGPLPCYNCNHQSSMHITSRYNEKGNARRPYYKCDPCNGFLVFCDDRGNHPDNPVCECKLSSKMQAAGPGKSRGVHFVCRVGRCNYYSALVDGYGRQFIVEDPAALTGMIRQGIL